MSDSPADAVVETPPLDDAGALAQDRFDYQVHLATARCARMLVDDEIASVICEWHEDYVVQYRRAPSELVSVKHLEGSQPRWTLAGLCGAGGLLHLFERWRRVRERCTCRLQTNCGLRVGADEPGALREACANGDGPELRRWATLLAPGVGSDDVEEVDRFLRALKIECELPDRHTVATVLATEVMRPVLRQLGFDERHADLLWRVLHDVVAEASRSGDRHDVSVALSDPDALAGDFERRRVLQRKTIDRARALGALEVDRSRPRVLLSSPPAFDRPRTRLVKKLERSGLGPTAIRSATRLRSNWLRIEHQWAVDLPGGQAELEHLRSHVVHTASQVERAARENDHPYGAVMQARMEEVLTTDHLGFDPLIPVSDMLLLGLVYDRTEACEVWWSDEFDADAAP